MENTPCARIKIEIKLGFGATDNKTCCKNKPMTFILRFVSLLLLFPHPKIIRQPIINPTKK